MISTARLTALGSPDAVAALHGGDRSDEALAQLHYADRPLVQQVPAVARLAGNHGIDLVELGRHRQALTALLMAERGFAALGDRLFAAKCLAYRARAELALGDVVAAVESAERAVPYLRGLATSTEYARVQLVRAETLSALHLLPAATALFDSLVAQFAAADLDHDLAEAQLGRGVVLARLGETRDADRAFAEAARRFGAVGDVPRRAVALLRRSMLGDGPRAKWFATMALAVLRHSGRAEDHAGALLRVAQLSDEPAEVREHLDAVDEILEAHALPHVGWQVLHERARRLRHAGNDAAARRALEAATTEIESVGSTAGAEHVRLSFMFGRRTVHEDLINLLLDQGEIAAAYERTGHERNRTLMERLRGGAASAPDVQAPPLHAGRIPSTATHRPSPPPRREVARVGLGAVVTYEIIGSEVLAFVDIDGVVRVHRALSTTGEVDTLLAHLDAQWRHFDDAHLAARGHTHLLASTIDLLEHMYARLFAPLVAPLDRDAVVVVPVGPLVNVPFGALHDGTRHVIERCSVTMAPSVQAARYTDAPWRTGTRRLVLGVADELAPRIIDEARSVAATGQGSTLLIDAEATVDALRAAAPYHDVIHLACHGVHQPGAPLDSGLRLSDGWLNTGDIGRMQLGGQLVVLSACESGRQQAAGTWDEVIGLPRAFLAAGAGGVVVNLWRADDASAADLMVGFHRRLDAMRPAQALRRAQLEQLGRTPHPYQWAPAVLVGVSEHV